MEVDSLGESVRCATDSCWLHLHSVSNWRFYPPVGGRLQALRRNVDNAFFSRASDERSCQKLEKVGPFECDDLEKHCRVSAKCYPTKVHALHKTAKEKLNSLFLFLFLFALQSKSQLLVINLYR